MFYRIVRRVIRKYAIFHLFIPLVVGVVVEAVYEHFGNERSWAALSSDLRSGRDIAFFLGIVGAYVVVIAILIRSETNIGLRHIDINELAEHLKGSGSLFAVSTTPFQEWFDPASQVYLATVYNRHLEDPMFRYERVLLLADRSAQKNLDSDYLDGYHARCFIDIHKRLGIPLYFVEWPDLRDIFRTMSVSDKVHIGLYPKVMMRLHPRVAKTIMKPFERNRVRRVAVGVTTSKGVGPASAFRFSKHDRVISIVVKPASRSKAYVKFANRLRAKIFPEGVLSARHDFTRYYEYHDY